jgi:hypothetical protein
MAYDIQNIFSGVNVEYAWWPLNETTGIYVYDYSGNNYTGIASTNLTNLTKNGIVSNSLEFPICSIEYTDNYNISGYYINLGNRSEFDFINNDSFSIGMWIYLFSDRRLVEEDLYDIAGSCGSLFSKLSVSNGSCSGYNIGISYGLQTIYGMTVAPAPSIYFTANTIGDNAIHSNHLGFDAFDKWNHIFITYDDHIVRFYNNGSFCGSGNAGAIVKTNQNLLIGNSCIGTGIDIDWEDQILLYNQYLPFDGKIDDIRCYDIVLSQEQIQSIYNKGFGTYLPLETVDPKGDIGYGSSIIKNPGIGSQKLVNKISNFKIYEINDKYTNRFLRNYSGS